MNQLELIEAHYKKYMRPHERETLLTLDDRFLYQAFKNISMNNYIEPYRELILEAKRLIAEAIPTSLPIEPMFLQPIPHTEQSDECFKHPETNLQLTRSIIISSSHDKNFNPETSRNKIRKERLAYMENIEKKRAYRERIEGRNVEIEPFELRRNPSYKENGENKNSIQRCVDRLKIFDKNDNEKN